YMAEADELCDRGAIIDQGKILARDTPSNLGHTLQKDVVFRLRVAPLPEQSPGAGGLADRVSALEGVCNCIQRQFDDHTELRLILKAEDVLTSVIGTLNNHGARLLSRKADADAGGCICRSRRSRTRARHQPRGRTACVSGAVHPQYQRKEKT
ncbi:MAG: hypothetical protein PVG11_05950, partial [Anaerolineae bacterium]